MNDLEAMKALIEGKKIRKNNWSNKKYYLVLIDGILSSSHENLGLFQNCHYPDEFWEIYEEPKTLKQEFEEYKSKFSGFYTNPAEAMLIKIIESEIARQEAKK